MERPRSLKTAHEVRKTTHCLELQDYRMTLG